MQVRAAGDDAWLGGPAPEDPTLDGVDASEGATADRLLLGGRNGIRGGPGWAAHEAATATKLGDSSSRALSTGDS